MVFHGIVSLIFVLSGIPLAIVTVSVNENYGIGFLCIMAGIIAGILFFIAGILLTLSGSEGK